MPKVKIRGNRQVIIPEGMFRRLDLKEGDVLEVFALDSGLVFIPEKMLRSKKLRKGLNERLWDRREEEASEAIAKGDVSGPFHSANELIAHLRKQKV